MSYYGDLRKNDVVGWVKPLLDQSIYRIRRSDGRFTMCKMTEPHSGPWHHIEPQPGAKCPYFHQQLFDVISERTPAGKFVPRFCQECWKIVIRPKTLDQLFALEGLLIQTGWPCKCGIEKRVYTPMSKHPYGGYIYNTSSNQGLERLEILRKNIDANPEFEGMECFLKRACTEMEMAFPDSSSWKVTDEQNRVEDILDWMVVYDIETSLTASHLVDKIHMGWIEWAAQHGDETYLNYTGGVRLGPSSVKYERKQEPELELEDSAPEKE